MGGQGKFCIRNWASSLVPLVSRSLHHGLSTRAGLACKTWQRGSTKVGITVFWVKEWDLTLCSRVGISWHPWKDIAQIIDPLKRTRRKNVESKNFEIHVQCYESRASHGFIYLFIFLRWAVYCSRRTATRSQSRDPKEFKATIYIAGEGNRSAEA